MSRSLRMLAAMGVTAALAGIIAVGSSLALPSEPASDGVLRLDWRVRSEEAGACILPTAEELEDLPAHMRNPDACVRELSTYRLTVRMNGETILDRPVEAGGLRGDRPLTVYDEVAIPPGSHQIRVEFTPDAGPLGDAAAGEPAVARESADAGTRDQPIQLSVEETVEIEAGRVVLAVRRQDTGALVLRSPVR